MRRRPDPTQPSEDRPLFDSYILDGLAIASCVLLFIALAYFADKLL